MEEIIETPPEDEFVEEQQGVSRSWPKYVIAALLIVVVLGGLLASGWGGYALAYVKCGMQQPLIAHSVENSLIYYAPDNLRYSVPGEGEYFKGYYCTEAQAKAADFLRAGP